MLTVWPTGLSVSIYGDFDSQKQKPMALLECQSSVGMLSVWLPRELCEVLRAGLGQVLDEMKSAAGCDR